MTRRSYAVLATVALLAGCTAATYDANAAAMVSTSAQVKPLTFTQTVKARANYKRMQHTLHVLRSREHRTPYVFSGSSTYGWDCSGLVRWTYKQFGLDIPHSADKQAHIGRRVSDPVPGDIVVFARQGSTHFYHAAIYLGHGKVINANYMHGTTVIQPLTDYRRDQVRFVRVVTQVANYQGETNTTTPTQQ